MKKLLFWCAIATAPLLIVEWRKIAPSPPVLLAPPYALNRLPVARDGELVFHGTANMDEPGLLIVDSRSANARIVGLGKLHYSSTQGCDIAYWSKDRTMVAIYDESNVRFNMGPGWARGYSWKMHRRLKPNEIKAAFTRHGGQGKVVESGEFRRATPREVAVFALAKRQ